MKPRVGTVGYLNAHPLTVALDPREVDLVSDYPRKIAAALADGQVDVALAPVAAALSDGDFYIVPGWCIGADGAVASVVIAAETEPEAWTELLLDQSSRTSIVLARLLVTRGPLAARVRGDLRITEVPAGQGPKRLGGTVASVVIGDPARALPTDLKMWDLAALWKAWTGLPFVFAVWATRADLPASVVATLREAGECGVTSIAERWEGDDRDYLLHNLRYPLDDAALIGLRRFAALAFADGLIGSEDVRLWSAPAPTKALVPGLERALLDAAHGHALDLATARQAYDRVPVAELGIAAHLARTTVRAAHEATYLVLYDAAGEESLEAVSETASARGAAAVALPPEAQPEAAAFVASAGLQSLVDTGVAEPEAWVRAGVSAWSWTVDGREAPETFGLPLHAQLRVDGDVASLFAKLASLRRAGDRLASVAVHLALPEGALIEPGRPATSTWLRALAVVRLVLPHAHVCASPKSQGLDASQTALLVGADDLGAVDVSGLSGALAEAERKLRAAGLDGIRRDLAWNSLGGTLTVARKVRPPSERHSTR